MNSIQGNGSTLHVVGECVNRIGKDRSFPYMGNVPVVRMQGREEGRIDFLIGCLLDEVLKDFLWRCQVELHRVGAAPGVIFLPRPPELISLANLPEQVEGVDPVIVYPDPPLSIEEEGLFTKVAPRVRLRSLMEWVAEVFQ